MHRDLKPANILLGEDYKTFKIIDFGVAFQFQNNYSSFSFGKAGTKFFMSPEMSSFKVLNFDPYKSDVYSFGIIILMLMGLDKE